MPQVEVQFRQREHGSIDLHGGWELHIVQESFTVRLGVSGKAAGGKAWQESRASSCKTLWPS